MSHHFNGGKWLAMHSASSHQDESPAVAAAARAGNPDTEDRSHREQRVPPATWRLRDSLTQQELLEWQLWTARLPKFHTKP